MSPTPGKIRMTQVAGEASCTLVGGNFFCSFRESSFLEGLWPLSNYFSKKETVGQISLESSEIKFLLQLYCQVSM